MSSIPATIKALRVQEDKSDVRLVEIPLAERPDVKNINDDYILLKVKAVGLNPTDWKHALGPLGTAGAIVGCDAAGEVIKVGSNVTHLKIGDRAAGFTLGSNSQMENGAFAEYVLYVGHVCFKLPEEMSYAEAAGFPVPHLTAVQALYIHLRIAPPSAPITTQTSILIWGGSTAVGHHAVQLAALSGYKVFVTASPAAFEDLKALGASELFDYKDPDVAQKIKAAAGEQGITLAVDTVSENGTTELVVASLSTTSAKNHVITVLPNALKSAPPKNTSIQGAALPFVLGIPFFHHALGQTEYPVSVEDRDVTSKWIVDEFPKLVEGWREGRGSPKFVGQRLRILPGGLESVVEGLRILKRGDYGREKLVYNIA
ncbi:GroES-like protein [Gymnopus androsaceus JB14]|uniref:GroES-like protein n=1 Tax=Gymnopus androsaceus JB14 TaxID=1447944 RepID=A0A6A4HVK6_9AGAR|nr:GroES-like protein [Gymnopus androsaceus JB14]